MRLLFLLSQSKNTHFLKNIPSLFINVHAALKTRQIGYAHVLSLRSCLAFARLHNKEQIALQASLGHLALFMQVLCTLCPPALNIIIQSSSNNSLARTEKAPGTFKKMAFFANHDQRKRRRHFGASISHAE